MASLQAAPQNDFPLEAHQGQGPDTPGTLPAGAPGRVSAGNAESCAAPQADSPDEAQQPVNAPRRVAVVNAVSCAAPQADSPDQGQQPADTPGRVPASNAESAPQAASPDDDEEPDDTPGQVLDVQLASLQEAPLADSPSELHQAAHAPGWVPAGNAESCAASPQVESQQRASVSAGAPGQVPADTPGQVPTGSRAASQADPPLEARRLPAALGRVPAGRTAACALQCAVERSSGCGDEPGLRKSNLQQQSPQGGSEEELSYSTSVTVELVDDDADVADTADSHQSDAAPETSEITAALSDGTASLSDTFDDVSDMHGPPQSDAANEALDATSPSDGIPSLSDICDESAAMRGPPQPGADDVRIYPPMSSIDAADTSEQIRLRNPHSERSEDQPAEGDTEPRTASRQLPPEPPTASGQLPPAAPLAGLRIILDEDLSPTEASRCASSVRLSLCASVCRPQKPPGVRLMPEYF